MDKIALAEIIVIGGGLAVAAYEIVNQAGKLTSGLNPATDYAVATSNPISEYFAASTIKSEIAQQNPNYSNAQVIFNSGAPISISALPQNYSSIIVTPTGIGTYNPLAQYNPSASVTSGGVGSSVNPFSYSQGWQGVGFYVGLPNLGGSIVVFIENQSQYNNPSSDPNYP